MSTDNIKQITAETGTNSNNHSSLFDKLQKGELIKSATIPAEDIKRLIKEPHRNVRVPIRIEDCVIKGDLDLQYTTFKYGLSIANSVFEGVVNFSFSRFERSVDFNGSRFKERADFRAAHAVFDFEIDLATFHSDASFEDLHVDEIFRAQGAQFNSVNFERIQIAKSALFCPSHSSNPQRTHFCGGVNFSDSQIQGPAHFEGADFQMQAIFDRAYFGSVAIFKCYQHNDEVHRTLSKRDHAACRQFNHQTLSFIRTRFGGPVSFAGARIQGDTSFDGAWFNDEANFEHVKISRDMNFQQLDLVDSPRIVSVNFCGATRFLGAQIGGNVYFSGAQFKRKADFAQVNIGGSAYFHPAHNKTRLLPVCFEAEAMFHNIRVQQTVVFQGAQFKQIAVFDRLQTGGGLHFDTRQLKVGFLMDGTAKREKRRLAESRFMRLFGVKDHSPDNNSQGETQVQLPTEEVRKIETLLPGNKLVLIEPWRGTELSEVFCPVRFGAMASLLDMRIGGTVDFRGAQFEGPAFFERLSAGGGIFFRAIDYGNPDSLENRLKYPIRICPVKFGASVSFVGAVIGGAAEFDGAQFRGDEKTSATFERIKIDGNTYFRPYYAHTAPVNFRKKVNFTGAHIKGDAEFSGAQFDDDTDFKGMQIDGNAYFDAKHHQENDTQLTGHEFNHVRFSGLADFSGVHFKNEAYFDNTRFQQKATFMGAEINGIVSFTEAVFNQETIFNEARFSLLSFVEDQREVSQSQYSFSDTFKNPSEIFKKFLDTLKAKKEKEPAQFKSAVDMRGTRYEIIKVNLDELTKGFTKSRKYDLQPYAHLERVLRAAGNDHHADYVYLQRRHRERGNLYKRSETEVS